MKLTSATTDKLSMICLLKSMNISSFFMLFFSIAIPRRAFTTSMTFFLNCAYFGNSVNSCKLSAPAIRTKIKPCMSFALKNTFRADLYTNIINDDDVNERWR